MSEPNSKKIRVVVFSPHSTCRNPERDCDTRARISADTVYKKLLSHGIPPEHITYIKHDVYRTDEDLNRFPSRHTEARKQLREVIYNLYHQYDNHEIDRVYLLEMHSFPDGWEIPIAGRNIVVLNRQDNLDVGRALVEHLGGSRENVELYAGTEKCDIQTEFTPGRDCIVPFLIEIAEDVRRFAPDELDKKLDQIADFVARDLAGPIVDKIEIGENVVELGISAVYFGNLLFIAVIILLVIMIAYYLWNGSFVGENALGPYAVTAILSISAVTLYFSNKIKKMKNNQ